MLHGVPPWKWRSSLLYLIIIAGFVLIADERIRKLLTKTPAVKRRLSFLRPAGINGVASSPKYVPVGFPPVMGSSPNPSFQVIGLRPIRNFVTDRM
jgi:hypothetical protein